MFEKINKIIAQIKTEKPLVLNITNAVTMDFIANGLLSLGASPLMSQAQGEMEELLQLAHTLVINIGTLNDNFIALGEYACGIANQLNKPIILDPVGAGASRYRTEACLKLINDYQVAIIRGNASEILALAGMPGHTKGVDSMMQSKAAIDGAQGLSFAHNAAIVVSGETDIIIDADRSLQLSYGSPMMPQVTGTGCLLSAVVGAFHAVEKNRFDASAMATVFYGMCGERAAKEVSGPASFKLRFLDELQCLPQAVCHAD